MVKPVNRATATLARRLGTPESLNLVRCQTIRLAQSSSLDVGIAGGSQCGSPGSVLFMPSPSDR